MNCTGAYDLELSTLKTLTALNGLEDRSDAK